MLQFRRFRTIASILVLVLPFTQAAAQKKSAPKKPAPAPTAATAPAEAPADTQPDPNQPKRLILKDGSFQQTVRWQKLGDRIHYLSAERYEWEDIPSSLIDWDATEKYFKEEHTARPSADAAAADAEEKADRQAEEAKSPEISPGLRLPYQGGVFLMDIYRNRPELVELVQNGSEIKRNTGRNVLRAAINPLAKAKQSIEVKGLHAQVQSHVPSPAIYVNIDTDQNAKTGESAQELSADHFRIVRLSPKKDARVVGNIEVAVYGKVSQKQNYVPSRSEPVSTQWVKVVPMQPLEPGEYALVELLGKDVNLYVWDFGINPTAPENAAAWKPAPVANTTTGTTQSPVLDQRPPK
ncbi:MAG: hypothetical protein ACR2IF_19185 [Terriglobales bacterium]